MKRQKWSNMSNLGRSRRRRCRGVALGGHLQRGCRFCLAANNGQATTGQIAEWCRPEIVYAGGKPKAGNGCGDWAKARPQASASCPSTHSLNELTLRKEHRPQSHFSAGEKSWKNGRAAWRRQIPKFASSNSRVSHWPRDRAPDGGGQEGQPVGPSRRDHDPGGLSTRSAGLRGVRPAMAADRAIRGSPAC